MTNKDYEFRDNLKRVIKEALNESTLKIQIVSDNSVLEDIKAEIRKCNIADFIAVQSVLEIIDNHISGKEQE